MFGSMCWCDEFGIVVLLVFDVCVVEFECVGNMILWLMCVDVLCVVFVLIVFGDIVKLGVCDVIVVLLVCGVVSVFVMGDNCGSVVVVVVVFGIGEVYV